MGMTVRSLAGEGETLLLLVTLPIAAAQRQCPPDLGSGEGQKLSGADDHLSFVTPYQYRRFRPESNIFWEKQAAVKT